MESLNPTTLIGYLAMAVLIASFSFKNIRRLRLWNALGCLLFLVYGFLIGAIPVLITNAFILVLNLYFLFIKKN
ncbi:MAG: YgjV family protein [Flavobacteriales bacterium]